METHKEIIILMHQYFDGEIDKVKEMELFTHIESCGACRNHFGELKQTISLIQSAENIQAPSGFTNSVISKLPKEKKRIKYKRLFQTHPILTAAAIFFILMLSGVFSQWNQDNELVVSKQENLIIKGDTVIVPENVVVDEDLVIQNGDLLVMGVIDGDVTIINGKLINEKPINGKLMASAGEVNGELQIVDRVFEWLWFQVKGLFKSVFSFSAG
ncbi:anti-sigma factor [Oceanobacillus sp. Castelsardo]|uniref:anti-sigma factor family protein n=1 Tax=Oceanobacillus sp. Castelsardo TaxID=1851204 RepID=UPI0008381B0F|nr:zf-HC2 domain-containing protein [Oceanobacillus sp. Castelsardo]